MHFPVMKLGNIQNLLKFGQDHDIDKRNVSCEISLKSQKPGPSGNLIGGD